MYTKITNKNTFIFAIVAKWKSKKVVCLFSTCRPPKLRTQEDGLVYLHPKSVNVDVKVFEDNWLIYHEKMKSSSVL